MKTLVLAIDLTGAWLFKEPNDAPGQPHILRVAMCGADAENTAVHLVKPEPGWILEESAVAVHGISADAARHGQPLAKVMNDVMQQMMDADRVVLYGAAFWTKVLDQIIPGWKSITTVFDAMIEAKIVMNSSVFPKFTDAYAFFTRSKYVPNLDAVEGGLHKLQATVDIYHGICRATGKEA